MLDTFPWRQDDAALTPQRLCQVPSFKRILRRERQARALCENALATWHLQGRWNFSGISLFNKALADELKCV